MRAFGFTGAALLLPGNCGEAHFIFDKGGRTARGKGHSGDRTRLDN